MVIHSVSYIDVMPFHEEHYYPCVYLITLYSYKSLNYYQLILYYINKTVYKITKGWTNEISMLHNRRLIVDIYVLRFYT